MRYNIDIYMKEDKKDEKNGGKVKMRFGRERERERERERKREREREYVCV